MEFVWLLCFAVFGALPLAAGVLMGHQGGSLHDQSY